MPEAGNGTGDIPTDRIQEVAGLFGMLASDLRLHIVCVLAQGECDVSGLAEQVGASLPRTSQQLAKLKVAGLVHARQQGRRRVYVMDDPDLVAIVRLLVTHLATGVGVSALQHTS